MPEEKKEKNFLDDLNERRKKYEEAKEEIAEADRQWGEEELGALGLS